jgi:hypothetical protein
VKVAERTLLLDPATETLYYLIARAHRITADIATAPAEQTAWKNKALEILQKREALTFEVEQIGVQTAEGEATVTGSVKNLKAEAGTPLKIRLTLVGPAGTAIGSQEFTVSAPAKDASATFEGKAPITGEVAGWKYEVVK